MLKIDIHKNVAFLVLDRPEIHNAFNDELVKAVTDAFTEIGRRNEVRVVVSAEAASPFVPAQI